MKNGAMSNRDTDGDEISAEDVAAKVARSVFMGVLPSISRATDERRSCLQMPSGQIEIDECKQGLQLVFQRIPSPSVRFQSDRAPGRGDLKGAGQAADDNFVGRIKLSAGIPNFSCNRQIMLSVSGRLRARIS